jgi:glycerol kinase
VNSGHIARASLEATAFQTREVLEAMNKDSGVPLTHLKVDGGMVKNNLLMQFQSDILQLPVIRPKISETTALGAAFAAGLAVGYWKNQNELLQYWQEDCSWAPSMHRDESEKLFRKWEKAVNKSLDWIE